MTNVLPPVLVRIRDLRFAYRGATDDVLRIPFLDVTGRGLIAITGPSGVGKSTLIELLAGTLREPYGGSVMVLGQEWKDLRRDADRQRQLRRIGLIPQDYGLLPAWTPRQVIQQDLADAGVDANEREHRTELALATVDLAGFADRRIANLSGGQRQRVAIARMLARDVDLVIADEPTANLDPELTRSALGLLRQLAARVPVLVITHDPAVAESCDRTIVLQSTVSGGSSPSMNPPSRHRRLPWLVGAAVVIVAGAAVAAVLASGPRTVRGVASQASSLATRAPSRPTTRAAATATTPTTHSAAASAATSTTLPPPTTTSSHDPARIVGAFYDAVDRHDWSAAWALGGRNFGRPYSAFVAGYQHTVRSIAVVSRGYAGGATVPVRLLAYTDSGLIQLYSGSYTAHGTTLARGDLTLIGTSSEPLSLSRIANAFGYTINQTTPASQAESGETLQAFIGICAGSGDGECQKAFFFYDGQLIGVDTPAAEIAVSLEWQNGTTIALGYPQYRKSDPMCCPTAGTNVIQFTWNGTTIAPTQPLPDPINGAF